MSTTAISSSSQAISASSVASSSSAVNSSAAASSASSASISSSKSSTQSSAQSSSAPSASSARSLTASSTSASTPASAVRSSSVVSKASATASTTAGTIISSDSNTASSKKTGLSSGAIGGIVGGVVGGIALGLLVLWLWKLSRRRRDKARYPLPPPRSDMSFIGGPAAGEGHPEMASRKGHESYNTLYTPSLPSYYPNYNRRVSSANYALNPESWPSPQAPYMNNTTDSSSSTTSQRLQPMSSLSSMALANAVAEPGDCSLEDSASGRPLPPPIQTTGLAPPASVADPSGRDISRRSSRSTLLFPHMPHSPSMTSMHSTGFGNTPHSGRPMRLTMPMPLDPSTNTDGYLAHSRTNSVSEFGQYTSMYGGSGSPASTRKRATRDSRRSLQPYHQGHLSPHFPSVADELASIPGAVPISGVSLHQNSSSVSTTTAPSTGPSRSGSGSAGSISGGGTSDSEALMISTAKGKQVDRSS